MFLMHDMDFKAPAMLLLLWATKRLFLRFGIKDPYCFDIRLVELC